MAPKKPCGQIGPVQATATAQGATLKWSQVPFSSNKAAIEQFIVDQFIDAFVRAGAERFTATQNEENDFDFTVQLPGGQVSLELVEAQYRDPDDTAGGSKVNPYESKEQRIATYEFAKQIADLVLKKSSKYGLLGKTIVHLLVYTTHWRFTPNETVMRLVQYFLQRGQPVFENVFFLTPTDEREAEVRVLLPTKQDPLEGHHPEEFFEDFYLNLNPGNWFLLVESAEKAAPKQ